MTTLGFDRLQKGAQIGGYQISHLLGQGTFGSVYAAHDSSLGRDAAIKVLHLELSKDADVVSRFISEARAVNRIRHPNIVDVFAMGALEDGRRYLMMELLDGEPLDRLLVRKGRLSFAEAYPILSDIAAGLDAAHRCGVSHRDLKPENVFVVTSGGPIHAKLLDFGMAKLHRTGLSVGHQTALGTPLGTPLYMAPEQCKGELSDHRADVYAFGVLVFELLSGSPPFDAASPFEVMAMHVDAERPRLSAHVPNLPLQIDALLQRVMDRSPSQRPDSVGEALAWLRQAFDEAAPPTLEAKRSPPAPVDPFGPTRLSAGVERPSGPVVAVVTSNIASGDRILSSGGTLSAAVSSGRRAKSRRTAKWLLSVALTVATCGVVTVIAYDHMASEGSTHRPSPASAPVPPSELGGDSDGEGDAEAETLAASALRPGASEQPGKADPQPVQADPSDDIDASKQAGPTDEGALDELGSPTVTSPSSGTASPPPETSPKATPPPAAPPVATPTSSAPVTPPPSTPLEGLLEDR